MGSTPGIKSICVMGLGYIGLPTATMFALKGFQVVGVDSNPYVVETVGRGDIHIVEPDLDMLVKGVVASGRLTTSLEPGKSDVYILAVPTPFKSGHEPDISYIETVTRAIAPHLQAGNLVILESTSPVGTTERVRDIVHELRTDLHNLVYYAHCPERVLPGNIIREFVENDRVIGGIGGAATDLTCELYSTYC